MIPYKKTIWHHILTVCAILCFPLSQADYNDSVVFPASPGSYNLVGDEYTTGYSYYSSDDPFDWKPPPPSSYGFQGQQVWLVPVLQYLLTVHQDGKYSMVPFTQLLPVLIAGTNWWFGEKRAAAIARQNGYSSLGTPFISESTAGHAVPMLEAPRKTTSTKRICLSREGQSSVSGGNGNGDSSQPPGDDPDKQGFGRKPPPPPPPVPSQESEEPDEHLHCVSKEIKAGGQTYTIRAYLRGKNGKLYCSICTDLVKPKVMVCKKCSKVICAEDSSRWKDCPECRHTDFEGDDFSYDLNNLPWECPECRKEYTEAYMTTHLRVCGMAWACNFAEHGCTATGTYEQVEAHEDVCGYRPENCPNQGCTEIVFHRDQISHATVCGYAQIPIQGTSITGPRNQIAPIITALNIISGPEYDQDSQQEKVRKGFFNLLEVAGEATTNPPAHEGETDSFSSAHETIAYCFNCGEPIMNKIHHECIVETCPVCSTVLTDSDKAFHRRYCLPIITFAGRRLTRITEGEIVGDNLIMYTGSPKSIYLVLPPGTVSKDMAPIYVSTFYTDSEYVMKMNMTLDSSGVEVAVRGNARSAYSITVFNKTGDTLYNVKNNGDTFFQRFANGALGSLPVQVLFICIFIH